MELSFLTPLGALFVLSALLPLGVYLASERRLRALRGALGLAEPSARSRLALVGALAGICALLALAAAQPVVATSRTLDERTDTEAFVVIDTSRSMLASAGAGRPTRFDRAREITERFAAALPELAVGVASMTDRVLPHVFPTTDRRVIAETLEKTMGVENPGPTAFYSTQATTFDALTAIPALGYYKPATTKRVLVVVTDGESRELVEDLGQAYAVEPELEVVFVRLWNASERIYLTGTAEIGYEPDQGSLELFEQVASAIDAQVLSESEAASLPQLVAGAIGAGPTVEREHEGRRRALMPWITLAALAPLAFVLYRRNA